ncbi:hypothetical protein IFM89_015219 [Coptis chinensis]|uniref:Uncharacterized protein n=1 Tax=Coptis chinensis TaxID=261450 RepID=A0A835LF89_9MAGN|nr:hypothetical protein IFM89_015219 [Coptis chinensis]
MVESRWIRRRDLEMLLESSGLRFSEELKKENGKRRKPEEFYTGKKMKDRKESVAQQGIFWMRVLKFSATSQLTFQHISMRAMPGIMSQMPPLPVSVNEELANIVLPNTPRAFSRCMCML